MRFQLWRALKSNDTATLTIMHIVSFAVWKGFEPAFGLIGILM